MDQFVPAEIFSCESKSPLKRKQASVERVQEKMTRDLTCHRTTDLDTHHNRRLHGVREEEG